MTQTSGSCNYLHKLLPYLGVQRGGLKVRWDLCQHGHVHLHFLALTVHVTAQPRFAGPNGSTLAVDVTVAVAGQDAGLGGHTAILDDVHSDEDEEEHKHNRYRATDQVWR